MGRNYLRYCKVVIGDGGSGIDVSNMRIKFKISQWTTQSPNIAEIRIYNLSDQTINKLQSDEYKKVTVEAGYEDNHGLIYEGEIKQKRKGRESPVDTYFDVFGNVGDKAYQHAYINKTLKAGSTPKDKWKAVVDAMKQIDPNIKEGYVGPDLSQPKYPRSFVMYGLARKFAREIAEQMSATWSVQLDGIQLVKNKDDSVPGEAITLNSMTGMIGMPVQTMDGIMVRALINPNFKIDSLLHIDESSIQEAQINFSYRGEGGNYGLPQKAADGIYRILAVDWIGDTRGTPWYADITCIARNSAAPPSQTALGRS